MTEPSTRDRVIDRLATHYAHDQITEADLEARLDRVYRATTEPELQAILADLPARLPAPSAAVPSEHDAGPRIHALFSGQERRLSGPVPSDLRLRARLGYVELDLTDATFPPGVTTIDVRAFMGYVEIRFPAGIRVESRGRALFGFFSLKDTTGSKPDEAATPVVRIIGRATFGYVEGRVGS